MNERQGSSLAAARAPARRAGLRARALATAAIAGGLLLAGCGQKGPLYLPAQAGPAATAAGATSTAAPAQPASAASGS
jgi:predicted small lipoprotein YifL